MITKEIAEMLNGIDTEEEIKPIDHRYAKCNGAVIVFGTTEGMMVFRGAIDDEAECYDGGLVYFNHSGVLRSKCHDLNCPYFGEIKDSASVIEAMFGAEGYAWTYKTDIPHETFEMVEDGIQYCRGIVFEIEDVKSCL